ncbi:MAG: 3-oxoacyl-[acyl-carrier-protein] synthase-1, partial [Lentisphaeria bacterium]
GIDMVQASMDAGVNRYELVNIFDEENNDLQMSLIPTIALNQSQGKASIKGDFSPRQERMLKIANHALSQITPLLPEQAIPLFLAGPESFVNIPGVEGGFIKSLAAMSGANIDIASSRFVNLGRAGAMDAIEIAFKYMSFSGNHFAIVGGVDSYYDYRVMQFLYDRYRVNRKGAYDGTIPGEAAAFLLLVSPDAPEELRQGLHYITRPVLQFEEGNLLGKGEYRGDALALSFEGALQSAVSPVSKIYSSHNGEMHYAKELTIAILRNHDKIEKDHTVHIPGEFVGDVGAAVGILAIALANTQSHEKTNTLVYCSSDSGGRAALCMGSV